MVVHDVIRDFARSTLSPGRVAELNGMLLATAARGFPTISPPGGRDSGPTVAWWEMGTGSGYLQCHPGGVDGPTPADSQIRTVPSRLAMPLFMF
jgi:hypothetical protein